MEFSEYVKQAIKTNKTREGEALQISLYGIAGEAGSVVSEAKKWFREGMRSPGLKENIREELGDLLWYIAFVSHQLDIDLDEAAEANLKKIQDLWSDKLPELPDYDDHSHHDHKFLRRMVIRFEEDVTGDIPKVRMIPEGELTERFKRERERKWLSANQVGVRVSSSAQLGLPA